MEDTAFIRAALQDAAALIVQLQAIAVELDRAATTAKIATPVTPWDSDNVISTLARLETAKSLL